MEKKISYEIRNIQHYYSSSMQKNFYVARIACVTGFKSWEDEVWNIGETLGM